ncbi:helix-turn-helix domain-containing protein [Phascolarctobacterium faecium]|uniref:helix-turn-helix domain-containing protein n=1 Tax=Phascolarctobacterium faecium TaxID=33025 RepID=UPI001032E936|nr:helix-turn-helix transcriptional regulator [Phascolarctobacterium faecium]
MEEPDYKTIGINIKIKRIRQGISQAKLAKLLGVSAAYLCNIENGKVKISLKMLYKLTGFFKCSLDDLLTV